MPVLAVRRAQIADAGLILSLLTELAIFEKLSITISKAEIARDFFCERPIIACEVAYADDAPVGLITYYWIYATFQGARRLYLEDLFVRRAFRGQGYGKALLKHMAAKADADGAARLEWRVLDWNSNAINLYRSIGARPHEGWYTYWLEKPAMKALAAS
jgi:GNAT superfamily N-acetyltransferase